MSEIFRMRVARSPQRAHQQSGMSVPLYQPGNQLSTVAAEILGNENPQGLATSFLQKQNLLSPANRLQGFFEDLDDWLTSKHDQPTRKELLGKAGISDGTSASGGNSLEEWLKETSGVRAMLGDFLIASLFADVDPGLRSIFTRRLLIVGVFEMLSTASPSAVNPTEIFEALRWRWILLPDALAQYVRYSRSNPGRVVVRTGFSDLYVVRSEWIRYEPGELAHIENVLPHEEKERKLTRVDERETNAVDETLIRSVDQRDSQSTDRFETSDEAQHDVALAVTVQAQVDTTGQYGPTRVDTHLGGSLSYSQNDSTRHATTQAKETITRAVSTVEKSVRKLRAQRLLTRTEEMNDHALKNNRASPINGMYRWVDKIQRFQVFQYPNRFLLEFQVPEPAAWLKWANARGSLQGIRSPNPVPLTTDGKPETVDLSNRLKFTDLTADNYATYAARYRSLGITPYPATVYVTAAFVQDTHNPRDEDSIKKDDPVRFLKFGDIAVPAGYKPARWTLSGNYWGEAAWSAGNNPASIIVAIGNSQQITVDAAEKSNDAVDFGPLPAVELDARVDTDLSFESPTLPVTGRLDNIRGYSLRVTMECPPSVGAIKQWQINTFEKIADAYSVMKRQYDDEVSAREISGGVLIEGDSPLRNQQVVVTELKKHVIEMLFSQSSAAANLPFLWGNAVVSDGDNEPALASENAITHASIVQFIEQAFEWDKLTYVLYPYYWADHDSRWSRLATIRDGADPEFANFLRSGSARIIVAARPGFEGQVQLFLAFGVLWGGGPVPVPGDPDYLSIAEEIKTLQKAPDQGIPGEWWDARLPTSLTWIDSGAQLPVKPVTAIKLGDPHVVTTPN